MRCRRVVLHETSPVTGGTCALPAVCVLAVVYVACVAGCCRVLQCVAVCCSVLQCDCSDKTPRDLSSMCVAACACMLQYLLQCLLQCVCRT